MNPSLSCASATPCSAASRNHRTASASSSRTPLPKAYIDPSLTCASASPCSAASRNHRAASASSSRTPSPRMYMFPIELRVGVALLGGEAQPPHRLGAVLRHTLAQDIHESEDGLSAGVALLRHNSEFVKGGGIVASHICRSRRLEGLRPRRKRTCRHEQHRGGSEKLSPQQCRHRDASCRCGQHWRRIAPLSFTSTRCSAARPLARR